LLGEDAGVAPPLAGDLSRLLRDGADVEDVDDEQVAGLGALDRDGSAQHVAGREVDVAHVVGRVVVADLPVRPLPALDAELRAGTDGGGRRDVGVPPVVAGNGLVAHGTGLVDAEDDFGHGDPPDVDRPLWCRTGVGLVVSVWWCRSGGVGPVRWTSGRQPAGDAPLGVRPGRVSGHSPAKTTRAQTAKATANTVDVV